MKSFGTRSQLLLQIAAPSSVLIESLLLLTDKLGILYQSQPFKILLGIKRNPDFLETLFPILFLYDWIILSHPVTEPEFQFLPGILEFHELKISLKDNSSINSCWIILIFFTRETRHKVPPSHKARIFVYQI